MKRKPAVILPLASALGALASGAVVADAKPAPAGDVAVNAPATAATNAQKPNLVASTGNALLGFVVSEQADGTVVAQHSSHASHASHASHHSHVSSR